MCKKVSATQIQHSNTKIYFHCPNILNRQYKAVSVVGAVLKSVDIGTRELERKLPMTVNNMG